jgi:hypothetical protein
MKKDDSTFEGEKTGEEALLDFEFEELNEKEVDMSSDRGSTDDEILELVDILETGDVVEDSGSDQGEALENDGDAFQAAGSQEGEPESLESDLDALFDGLEPEASGDVDLDFLEADLKKYRDVELGEAAPGPFSEELTGPPGGLEQQIGLSEERIEAIITQTVERVVEKVTRETMVTVAEKVIGEAIEALRQSLESSSD